MLKWVDGSITPRPRFLGQFSFTLPKSVTEGGLRPLSIEELS